jgi:hypothetical protein
MSDFVLVGVSQRTAGVEFGGRLTLRGNARAAAE